MLRTSSQCTRGPVRPRGYVLIRSRAALDSLGLAQQKDELDFRAGLEVECGLDGRARIEGLARGSGQTDSCERRGSHQSIRDGPRIRRGRR